ncbi:DNA polymerase III subunit gamma/tau [Pyxidicoccus sp. MSG2]|uniref:DNA polymerase III subunit gamma/tau n=1 Tax=Pyxidicoccus sp. MSG2 TaxID=2996790 RepID=UPI00226FC4EB|nr:DNA polymerase III subunit gamma/tau [Pyxidicoccus sp. MSG2]MCY1016050.1 DNA polymerase III subunit gamma/tau [Pyxidicoccus sp. MSG2]
MAADPRPAEPVRGVEPVPMGEPRHSAEPVRSMEVARHAEPLHAGPAVPVMPPVAPTGPLMDDLPPSAARPLSFLRNGGGAGATALTVSSASAVPAYSAEDVAPSGPLMDGLPPTAARPLSFLRKNGGAQPPSAPTQPPAGATPLSRTTEPAPSVRVTNVRKQEPQPGPSEPSPYAEDDDARYYPEEASPEGCASGECIPDDVPSEPLAAPAAVEPMSAPSAPGTEAPVSARPTFVPPPAAAPEPRAPASFAPEPDPEPEPESTAPAPVARGRDNPNLPLIERWRAAVESVKGSSLRHGTALANGRLLSMRAGEIVLGYLPTAGLHRMTVSAAAGKTTIDKLLAEHFGRPVRLSFQDITADDSRATLSIAEQDAQSRANHEKSTEGKVRGHPAVRAVLKFLGGEIEHIQVYEPERPSAVPAADTPDDSA